MFINQDLTGTKRLNRRDLLRIGGLGCLGLDLAGALQAEAATSQAFHPGPRLKSCILIFCNGGPSHLDTFDIKPDAPAEVRGEFRSIATSVPGQRVCEHLPMTARVMHRVAVIRSMHHRMTGHRSGVTNALCGLPPLLGDVCTIPPEQQLLPSYGARLGYLLNERAAPLAHLALPYTMRDSGLSLPGQSAGFLGPAYERFQVEGDPSAPGFDFASLRLPADVTLERLEHRESLLRLIDAQLPGPAERESGTRMAACRRRAFRLLASDVVRRSFDLAQESLLTRERYGRNIVGQSVLLARRLVEAGVRFVNVNVGDQQNDWYWDDHKNVFGGHRKKLVPLDRAFSAVVEDLHERGLLDSTLVITMGEFGRTPKINSDAGRDHWPNCYSAVLAGGGVKGGIYHGASDKLGAYPTSDAVTPGDLAATLFARFGLDPATEIIDRVGRPYRLAEGTPITRIFTR
jgi:hypothetical protein